MGLSQEAHVATSGDGCQRLRWPPAGILRIFSGAVRGVPQLLLHPLTHFTSPPSPHPTSPAASEIQTESCPHLLKPPGVPPGALNQPQPHRNGGLPGGAASLASSLEAAGPLPGCIHLQEPGLLLPLPLAPPLWAGTSCAQVWALVSYVSRVPDPPTQVRSLLWAPEFGGRLPLQTQRPGSRTPSGAQGSILMSFKIRRKTLNF